MDRTQDPKKIHPKFKLVSLEKIMKESREEFIDCLSQVYDLDKSTVLEFIEEQIKKNNI